MLAANYGVGRATPLVAIVMLGSTGIESLRLAARYKESFDRAIGCGLVALGSLMRKHRRD